MLIVGAILYTNIGFAEFAEHTGIYLGADRIVELNGDGTIKIVNSWNFLNSSAQRTGDRIYIATDQFGYPLKNKDIALRAIKQINNKWEYDLLMENCHEFTAGTITNIFENDYNFFFMINELIKEKLNNNQDFKWQIFKINKLTPLEDIWVTKFFSTLKMSFTMMKYKADIKTILVDSGLSTIIKETPNSQKEFLEYYKELFRYEWKKNRIS